MTIIKSILIGTMITAIIGLVMLLISFCYETSEKFEMASLHIAVFGVIASLLTAIACLVVKIVG